MTYDLNQLLRVCGCSRSWSRVYDVLKWPPSTFFKHTLNISDRVVVV